MVHALLTGVIHISYATNTPSWMIIQPACNSASFLPNKKLGAHAPLQGNVILLHPPVIKKKLRKKKQKMHMHTQV